MFFNESKFTIWRFHVHFLFNFYIDSPLAGKSSWNVLTYVSRTSANVKAGTGNECFNDVNFPPKRIAIMRKTLFCAAVVFGSLQYSLVHTLKLFQSNFQGFQNFFANHKRYLEIELEIDSFQFSQTYFDSKLN